MTENGLEFYGTFDPEALVKQDRKTQESFERGLDVLEAAALVRIMRATNNLSQQQLATRLGVTAPRVSEIERGVGSQGPTYELLKRVARACEVELAAALAAVSEPLFFGNWGRAYGIYGHGSVGITIELATKANVFTSVKDFWTVIVTRGEIAMISGGLETRLNLREIRSITEGDTLALSNQGDDDAIIVMMRPAEKLALDTPQVTDLRLTLSGTRPSGELVG